MYVTDLVGIEMMTRRLRQQKNRHCEKATPGFHLVSTVTR